VQEQIAAGIKASIIRDQGNFLADYHDLQRRIQYEAANVAEAERMLADEQARVAKREAALQQRVTEVQREVQELARLKAETNSEVARLEAMQRDLFSLQQRFGQALEATEKLNEQLSKPSQIAPGR
jgi:chromosome segregation ATPase